MAENNCVCQQLYHSISQQLTRLISSLAQNNISSGTSHSEDGSFTPNLHLLDGNNTNFDLNSFFYTAFIIFAIITLATLLRPRRRQGMGGGSSS